MKINFLVIIFSGISISLIGIFLIPIPAFVGQLIERNLKCFFTIPPISVFIYIFVFNYHEKFQKQFASIAMFLGKALQSALTAFIFFFYGAFKVLLLSIN